MPPLFVCLAGAYLRRTNDLETISSIWSNLQRALEWIDQYGDINQDGFVEYVKKRESGLDNQGWKDSRDSVSYSTGELANPPIALCEVQGYVYDAKVSAADMAEALGEADMANHLRTEAQRMKENFIRTFWCPEKNIYAMALDGAGRICKIITSNSGHCLFSGIASEDHAPLVAETLLSPDSFSGWGIRTLARNEVRYNPMSYHNGSICMIMR